ncbi:MAG: hypothetical protein OHK0011_00890 [Turneriella sp.]
MKAERIPIWKQDSVNGPNWDVIFIGKPAPEVMISRWGELKLTLRKEVAVELAKAILKEFGDAE